MRPQYEFNVFLDIKEIFWIFFSMTALSMMILITFKQRKLIRKVFKKTKSMKF